MRVFADTSALFTLLDADDVNHPAAREWIGKYRGDPALTLITHNYVVVESVAVIQRRLGPEVVRALFEGILPLVDVMFIDEQLHRLATSAFLAAIRRRPSLVDWVSFEFMRQQGIQQAFAFDRDFRNQGFATVP